MGGDMPSKPLSRASFARTIALAIAVALAAFFALTNRDAHAGAVGVDTRFDYVAVFPLAVTEQQIEEWRQKVLGQPRQHGCMGGRPCVARTIRLALAGSGGREVIAFDLMPEVSSRERAAIAAAAVTELPGTALHIGARPSDVDSIRSETIH